MCRLILKEKINNVKQNGPITALLSWCEKITKHQYFNTTYEPKILPVMKINRE